MRYSPFDSTSFLKYKHVEPSFYVMSLVDISDDFRKALHKCQLLIYTLVHLHRSCISSLGGIHNWVCKPVHCFSCGRISFCKIWTSGGKTFVTMLESRENWSSKMFASGMSHVAHSRIRHAVSLCTTPWSTKTEPSRKYWGRQLASIV